MVFQTQSVTNEYQWLERNALVLAHNLHAHFIPLKTVSLDTSAHLLIPNVLPSISWDANSALGEAHAPLGYLRILGGIVDQFILSKTVAEGFGTNMQELRNIGDLKMRVEKQMLQVRCHVVLMCIALCDSVSHIKISVRAQKTMHLHCICTKPGYRISPKKKTPIFWLELVKKIPSKPGIHGRSFLQPRRFLHLDGIFHNFPIPHSSTISDCTGYTGGMPGPKKWNFCRSNMPPAWHHRVTVRPNQKPRFVKSLRCLEARKRRCITWIPNEIHQQRRQRSWTIWCFLVCGVGGWVGIQPSQKEDRFWKGGPKSFLKIWRDGDVVKSGESQIQLPTCIFPCKACQLLFPVLPRCLNANCDSDIQRQRSDLEKGPFMGTWRHQVSRGSKVWWASSS